MSDLVKISGLWANQKQDGEVYYTGSLGNAKIVIFKNKFKDTDKHPDMHLYISPSKKQDDNSRKSDIWGTAGPDTGDGPPF
jgi:hypothetical protein